MMALYLGIFNCWSPCALHKY